MSVIGELNADGSFKTEPDVCAITGRPLGGHMSTQRIKDTNYFYVYISDFQFKLTDELRAEIEAQVPKGEHAAFEPISKTKAVKPVEKE